MANAAEILGDRPIIYGAFDIPLKIYEDDDLTAKKIKDFINTSVPQMLRYKQVVEQSWKNYLIWCASHKKWNYDRVRKQGPKYIFRREDPKDLLLLKVNHYRQKYWYWKKLKI